MGMIDRSILHEFKNFLDEDEELIPEKILISEKYIFAAFACEIRIYDRKSYDLLRIFNEHDNYITEISYDEDVVVSCSTDGYIKFWVPSIYDYVDSSNNPYFDELIIIRGENILTGYEEIIKLWSLSNETYMKTIGFHEKLTCIDMNYSIIVSGSDDGTIKIWKEGFTPAEHWANKGKIHCVYISELYILTGSRNIGIWNHDGVCLKILEGHRDMVSCVKFYDGYVISGSYDCSVRVWDIDDGCINILRGHIRPIKNIAIDKHEIISTSEDGKIIVWSR